jgi:Zn-dependent M28 family amino/carboxypeptidase
MEDSRIDLCERLWTHVGNIVGERNPFLASTKHGEVRRYLKETLGSYGTGTFQRHTFHWQGAWGVNMILKIPGKEVAPPALIGAHYDTVPGSPGADDNASGVAVLLEMARLLDQIPPRQPVWLVAFDLEEWRMQGSKALARQLKEDGEDLSWMASLEMVGCRRRHKGSQRYPFPFRWFYPDLGDFILLLGNTPAHGLMSRITRTLEEHGVKTERFTVPFKGWLIPPTRLSDQSPFWDIGVPGVMVTDTAWRRNPNYHQPTDTMDTLDIEFMADITLGLSFFLRS